MREGVIDLRFVSGLGGPGAQIYLSPLSDVCGIPFCPSFERLFREGLTLVTYAISIQLREQFMGFSCPMNIFYGVILLEISSSWMPLYEIWEGEALNR
jgi:hypothetical protein